MTDYAFILFFILFSFSLAIILFSASFLLISKNYDIEKVSPYECGFDPFEDTRSRFEIRFYLVAILFIIFDLEVVFLFPWAVIFNYMDNISYFVMMLFLFILTIGFIFEWLKGALDWE